MCETRAGRRGFKPDDQYVPATWVKAERAAGSSQSRPAEREGFKRDSRERPAFIWIGGGVGDPQLGPGWTPGVVTTAAKPRQALRQALVNANDWPRRFESCPIH